MCYNEHLVLRVLLYLVCRYIKHSKGVHFPIRIYSQFEKYHKLENTFSDFVGLNWYSCIHVLGAIIFYIPELFYCISFRSKKTN